MNAVEVNDLTRRYGYRTALRKISFSLEEGGIHGLFGANGAGKTTLMRILSTILRPHKGEVRVLGLDPEEDTLELRARLGIVGDKPLLYAELTGRENLRFYGRLYGMEKESIEKRIEDLSQRFDVFEWLDEPTKILSTGLRKRFDVARSLIHDPELYLLDEPFSGLDQDSSAVFLEYLDDHRNDRTVLLTTHNLALGARICDDYLTLKKGEVTGQGPISEFEGKL
ncbi:MAG: ABC transporter ATP-binding protein [Candidatus Thorarchaeota archaeon]|nr:MAG: ABC transporter ATP-binding protein [Candidatus Thorarchaeota archaeon]